MFNQPNILVCSDMSEAADHALKFANALAQRTRGTIKLLHIAPDISFVLDQYPLVEESKVAVIRDNLLHRLRGQLERCKVKGEIFLSFHPNTATAILDYIQKKSVDVVVAGSTGQGHGFFPLGGTARKLAVRSEKPLFLIRDHIKTRKVAALVDGGDESLSSCIDQAHELSYLFSSKPSVISVVPKFPGIYSFGALEYAGPVFTKMNEEAEAQVKKLRNKITDSVVNRDTEILVQASAETDIGLHLAEILNDGKVDIAVLKRGHKNSFERFLLGSISTRVLELFSGNIFLT